MFSAKESLLLEFVQPVQVLMQIAFWYSSPPKSVPHILRQQTLLLIVDVLLIFILSKPCHSRNCKKINATFCFKIEPCTELSEKKAEELFQKLVFHFFDYLTHFWRLGRDGQSTTCLLKCYNYSLWPNPYSSWRRALWKTSFVSNDFRTS